MKQSIVVKISNTMNEEGIKGICNKIAYRLHIKKRKHDFIRAFSYITDMKTFALDKVEKENHNDDDIKLLNWIIPEMGAGAGGHNTIFRIASMLEDYGYHSKMYSSQSVMYHSDDEFGSFAYTNYPVLDRRVELISGLKNIGYCHAVIATSYHTAYIVNRFNNCDKKIYFVQDFEPYFEPVGSAYQFAENTYKMGFYGITAGKWLKSKLEKDYGMWTRSFEFSYDKDVYKAIERSELTYRIYFYTRPYTARRYFELGLLALNEVSKRMPNVTIVMSGEDLSDYDIPFKHEQLGILPTNELARVIGGCDMSLCISGTNLSLMPLEVMGAGSVCVSNSGDNAWIINDSNSIVVDTDPFDIANKIVEAYNNPEKLKKICKNGIDYAKNTSWAKAGKDVADALDELLK